jgi:hypothetical protein
MITIIEPLNLSQTKEEKCMKLRDLFEKDIDRNINGVVKVEQVNNEAILEQELDEFVITKELTKHFSRFYTNYNNSLDSRTDKIGVWISGFFGSGKSHFLKMLSYLLENKTVGGKCAVDYFNNKNLDDMTLADIKRATTVPTETILFNIDSQSSKDSKDKKDGIVEIFLKVFNKKLGYCAEVAWLANIERIFDKDGIYEDFKKAFKEVSGCEWVDVRGEYAYRKDEFVQALMKVKNISEQSARDLLKEAKSDYSISSSSFAALIKEYLDSKGPKNRIIFLVDEIGQFISDNTNLMLGLQTVVEDLGSMCNGRAWVMVTSQEAIDTITKERFRDQDFSKIQGRFDTKLSLSGANTDEVIKRRLLAKTETAKQVLGQHYNEQEKILANLITFSSQTAGMKVYSSSEEFVDCYPFIPYQFNLLQSVFSSLRKFSHAGAHLADSERSMLNAFHAALMEYGDKEITELVPFNVFYSTIKTFIDTEIVRIIEQAKDGNPDIEDFDIEVLIVLFLIKYIKEVPCDVENIATLMVSNINDSKNILKSKINSALTRLKKATLIQENGDIYDFLTNEEQDVSRGIKTTSIDTSDVLNEVYNVIFTEILDNRRSVTPISGHTYYFTRKVDDVVRGAQEDTEIKFITKLNPDYQWGENELKLKFSADNVLYIKLADNTYLQELETILKTAKYIRQKSSVKQTVNQDNILKSKANEITDRKIRVKTLLEQAIMDSAFYTAGDRIDVQATSASAKIENAMKIVIENTYNKLNYVVEHVNSDRDIYAKFSTPQTKVSEPNKRALDEIFSWLNMQAQMNCAVTMQNVKTHFIKQPYGWSLLDIAGLIADLAGNNQISVNYNGANINRGDVNITRYLTNDKEIQRTEIKIKVQIDSEKIRQVISIVRDLFEKTDIQEDGERLAEQIKKEFIPSLIDELQDIKSKYTNAKYPDKSIVDAGIEVFKSLRDEPDTNTFFDKLIAKSEELLVWHNNFKLVKSFFENQKTIFDEALNIKKIISDNQIYLNMIECPKSNELNEKVGKISEILNTDKPYSQIKELPFLTNEIQTIYQELLNDYKQAIGEIISDHANYIAEEATKAGLDVEPYSNKFKINVTTVYETVSDFNKLSAVKEMSSRYFDEILKQINTDAFAKQPVQIESSDDVQTEVTQVVRELDFVKPANICDKQILETEEDVDAYVSRLSEELKARIRANKRIKLQ